jgi:hypothetical protein
MDIISLQITHFLCYIPHLYVYVLKRFFWYLSYLINLWDYVHTTYTKAIGWTGWYIWDDWMSKQ